MPPLLDYGRVWIVAGLLLGSLSLAGQGPATTVEFAPRVAGELQRYGEEEGGCSARRFSMRCRARPDGSPLPRDLRSRSWCRTWRPLIRPAGSRAMTPRRMWQRPDSLEVPSSPGPSATPAVACWRPSTTGTSLPPSSWDPPHSTPGRMRDWRSSSSPPGWPTPAVICRGAGTDGNASQGGVGPSLTRTRSFGRSHLRNAPWTSAASSAM